MAAEHPYRTLNSLGWQWHEGGAVLWVNVDGQAYSVWVPISRIAIEFGKDLDAIGCPLPGGIGGPCGQSVGGFFSGLRRAVKRVARKVRKVVPKSIRRAARRVARRAKRAARKISRTVKRVGRRALKIATSREAQLAMMALTAAVPALAPATGSILAAQEALRHVDTGVKAAKAIQRGAKVTRRLARDLSRAKNARNALNIAREGAARGDREAQQLMGALRQLV